MMHLSILNLNLWLLPPPASAENRRRLERFVELAKEIDPDVITLQEVWLKQYIGYFKKQFPGFYFTYSKSIFLNDGGLVTISRYKPLSSELIVYPTTKGYKLSERLGKKGFQKIKFNIEGKEVYLINTHLYYPSNEADNRFTFEQFEFLKNATKDDDFVIVCGDLNIKNEDFLKLNNGHFQFEDNNDHTQNPAVKYMKMRMNRFNRQEQQKIDYLLIRTKDQERTSLHSTMITDPDVSDHIPILSSIVLF